jgi:hypothetical protein
MTAGRPARRRAGARRRRGLEDEVFAKGFHRRRPILEL